MGRRAKNKQGDPLPLEADPDLNGSFKALKSKTKPGLKGRSSAPNLKTKLGKRKPERNGEDERVTKKPKGIRPAGKSKPQTKAAPTKRLGGKGRSNGKKVNDGATDDDDSVGWEDVENVAVQAEARCVCLTENIDAQLQLTNQRSLFHDSDATGEEDEDEEFTGFSGNLEDLNSDEDETEEYVPLFPSVSTPFEKLTAMNL